MLNDDWTEPRWMGLVTTLSSARADFGGTPVPQGASADADDDFGEFSSGDPSLPLDDSAGEIDAAVAQRVAAVSFGDFEGSGSFDVSDPPAAAGGSGGGGADDDDDFGDFSAAPAPASAPSPAASHKPFQMTMD